MSLSTKTPKTSLTDKLRKTKNEEFEAQRRKLMQEAKERRKHYLKMK